jgi:4-hydroxyphenylacetate 3-monooxygenase
MNEQTGVSSGSQVTLTVAGTGQVLAPRPRRLVVGGYTGRDETAVRAHISELAAIGVPPPPEVPAFYLLPPDLLTIGETVEVASGRTSGEVEPVLLRVDGRYYIGVGSDHTDRDLEREDIAKAKAACPKPIGPVVAPLPPDLGQADWDGIEMACHVDRQAYQRGWLSSLRTPADLLSRLPGQVAGPEDDLVVFCGTLPLLTGEFVAGRKWQLDMRLPGGPALSHAYETKRSACDAHR